MATNLRKLRQELNTGHPDTGPYSFDHTLASDQINEKNRTRPRSLILPTELFQRLNKTELIAVLSDVTKEWQDVLISILFTLETLDFNDNTLYDIFIQLFGENSTTVRNITGHAAGNYRGNDLRIEKISRVEELDLGKVLPGTIQRARRI